VYVCVCACECVCVCECCVSVCVCVCDRESVYVCYVCVGGSTYVLLTGFLRNYLAHALCLPSLGK
jgi:hypothetical protein